MDYMIYVGPGDALHDVPARNLTKLEAENVGVEVLLRSGLYVMADPPISKSGILDPVLKPKSKVAEQPAKDGE